jgi:hypothetical protein
VTEEEVSSVDGTRPPPIIRAASILLVVAGIVSVVLSFPTVVDPSGARCHLSRSWLDEVNTDKKEWNDVDTGGTQAEDLACADAIRLADQIRLKETSDKTASVPGETALRIQAALAVLMSAGQSIAGTLVMRRLSRQARNVAIAFSAVGIILRILGIISIGVFVFVVYALAFSPASREIWPKEPRE